MNFEYTIDRNNMQGELRAKTREGFDVPGHVGYFVEVSTSKSSRGGISSTARVYQRDGNFNTTDLFGDWHKTLATNPGRATEKNLRGLHETALDGFADQLVEARAHTMKKLRIEETAEA